MTNLKLNEDMQKLLVRFVLSDKRINPEKITAREIAKKWEPLDVLQVWKAMYAVQVQSVEDFTQHLLGQVEGAAKQKPGGSFRNGQGSLYAKSSPGPLMPRYLSRSELAKATDDKTISSNISPERVPPEEQGGDSRA